MAKKAPKNNDIKFSTLKKKAKEVNLTETYELEDGSTITFYPVFPPTLIDEMFNEIQTIFSTMDEGIKLTDEQIFNYVMFMCIKHFTHLKSQLKADTFAGQLEEHRAILDAEIYDLIINELFSQKEIHKVLDKLSKIGSTVVVLDKLNQQMYDHMANLELKNADIFKQLGESNANVQ